MAYTPHVWIPRLGSNLNRFTKANETTTSVDLTNAPEIVTQAGTPFSTDIMNEMEEGITDANAGIGLLATCATAAATQIKEINLSDYTIKVGMHISIDFTYTNTYGTPESASNVIATGSGVQIRIVGENGTFLFNDFVGGEAAGSGSWRAGECHDFVITTMATGNTSDTAGVIKDRDAKYIYSVTGDDYYSKDTNGFIGHQIKTVGSPDSIYTVHSVETLEGLDQTVLLCKLDNPAGIESKKGFAGNIIISRGGIDCYNVDGFITGFLTKAYYNINGFLSGPFYMESVSTTYTYGKCKYKGEYYLYIRFSGAMCWFNFIGAVFGGWVGVSVPSAECSDFSNN